MTESARCEYCNGAVIRISTYLPFNSKALGQLKIPNVEQYKCTNCGYILLSLEETDKIAKYIRDKEQEAINGLPIGEFITLNEAAGILGITKQAFNKNPRIKRGMIYFVCKEGRKFYYRKSVEAFKQNGKDGRIPLGVTTPAIHIQIAHTRPYEKPLRSIWANSNISTEVMVIPNLNNVYKECVGLNTFGIDSSGVESQLPDMSYMFDQREINNARKIR